ncbi:hypothetical protein MRB53_003644 [Persea americana]|uniref:Uncharacterized protein n=1 Tax=Persea americana TaxID=3435 RepID=A0ACC2MXY3_PERAE|nr:hypothetical protein MRB53_003644 [Persea americana]
MRKGSSSMDDYLQNAKLLADSLTASGHPMLKSDLQQVILNGLDTAYDPIVTSLTTTIDDTSMEDFNAHLLAFESRLQNQLATDSVNPSANVAAKSSSRNSFSPSSNRGRSNNQVAKTLIAQDNGLDHNQLVVPVNSVTARITWLPPVDIALIANTMLIRQAHILLRHLLHHIKTGSFPFAKAATVSALPVPNVTHWLLTPPPLLHLPGQPSSSSLIPPSKISPLQAQRSGPATMRAPPSQPSTPSNCVQASPLVQSRVPHHLVDPHGSPANRPHTAATNNSSQSKPSIESWQLHLQTRQQAFFMARLTSHYVIQSILLLWCTVLLVHPLHPLQHVLHREVRHMTLITCLQELN